MVQPALAPPHSALLGLLEQQFTQDRLSGILETGDGGEVADLPWRLWNDALYEPLADFLSREGKEFRSRFVQLGWSLAEQTGAPPAELAALVEVLHAGSLIIDDIEDNSDMRRGRPALHHCFGTPRALNAGNWLYFFPQALLRRLELPPAAEIELHRTVGETLLRSHYGQALDLTVSICTLAQHEIPAAVYATSRLKTGSLFELAGSLGAIVGGCSRPRAQALATLGARFGIALQMLDDLSGLVRADRSDKGIEDLQQGRPTWAWAWLADRAPRRRFEQLRSRLSSLLSKASPPSDRNGTERRGVEARPCDDWLALRDQLRSEVQLLGRQAIRDFNDRTAQQARAALGDPKEIDELDAELRRLEKAYVW